MTFPSGIHVSDPQNIIGPYPGGSLFTKAVDENPFKTITPINPPHIIAAQLSKENFNAVIIYLLKNGNDPVFLPADRSALEVGEKRFRLGDTLVLEFKVSSNLKSAVVRAPTRAEAATYGLTGGNLHA